VFTICTLFLKAIKAICSISTGGSSINKIFP
jgi:hypothetical protein